MNLDILKEKIAEALKDKNIIVCSVTYKKNGKYNFLTVELDKVNGIDIDTIVDATHIINPIVDKEVTTKDSYILDVISKERG